MSKVNVYVRLRDEFSKVCKRVCKENSTKNRDKHREYLIDLVISYNNIIRHIATVYNQWILKERKPFVETGFNTETKYRQFSGD